MPQKKKQSRKGGSRKMADEVDKEKSDYKIAECVTEKDSDTQDDATKLRNNCQPTGSKSPILPRMGKEIKQSNNSLQMNSIPTVQNAGQLDVELHCTLEQGLASEMESGTADKTLPVFQTPEASHSKKLTAYHIITTPVQEEQPISNDEIDRGTLNYGLDDTTGSPIAKQPRRKVKTAKPTAAFNTKKQSRTCKPVPASKSSGVASSQSNAETRCNKLGQSTSSDSRSGKEASTGSPSQKQIAITKYFPVRRSARQISTDIKKHDCEEVEYFIESKKQEGLEVKNFEGKGRGIVATQTFHRKAFVVEYAGDLLDVAKAKEKEAEYVAAQNGCYMYYFNHKNKNYCIDATAESEHYGRLVNHSRRKPNCHTKVVEVKGEPRLILKALRDINPGEEILYDYGDRSKEALEAHPWLAF